MHTWQTHVTEALHITFFFCPELCVLSAVWQADFVGQPFEYPSVMRNFYNWSRLKLVKTQYFSDLWKEVSSIEWFGC